MCMQMYDGEQERGRERHREIKTQCSTCSRSENGCGHRAFTQTMLLRSRGDLVSADK